MVKVAIYCRLSVEDRGKTNAFDDSESIQNQKTLLTRYAVEQGWAIYGIYSDDDYSGLDRDRPEFNRMMEDARQGRFHVVLCKSQSRFTRDMELVEKYLHSRFVEWGVRFISLTDNVDTAERGNKKSRQINGLVNEWYCEDISEAVRASFRLKQETGQFIGSHAPYGYQKDPKNKNRLLIDEEAAQTVRKIFRWYLEGYGTQKIAQMLNERGILNPTGYKQSKGISYVNPSQRDPFSLWNRTTVKRILINELYIGNMVQGKRRKVSYKSRQVRTVPREDWYIVRNTHAPIIGGDDFTFVQKRMAGQTRSGSQGQAHLFAARVRCMDCGNAMNKVTAPKGYVYLRCKLYAAGPRGKLCSSHSIRLDRLASAVAEQVQCFLRDLCDEGQVAGRLLREYGEPGHKNTLKNEYKRLAGLTEENATRIRSLYLDKLRGILTEEQFIEFNQTFLMEKERLEKRLARVRREMEGEPPESPGLWAEFVRKYRTFTRLTRVMVNEFIDYIEIGEKDTSTGEQVVRIHWQF